MIRAEALLALLLVGCAAAPASIAPPSPTSSPTSRPSPAVIPTPTPTVSPEPSFDPEPTPDDSIFVSPTRRPADPLPSPWSGRVVVASATCQSVAAVIDGAGGNHVAAGCQAADRRILYAEQVNAKWRTTTFSPPAGREELGPQLAVQGDVLYLAYTRIRVEEGGCGDQGLRDVGVYVRTRTLPSGAWSEAAQIGEPADHLQSFRVVGGTFHATVLNAADGLSYYETVSNGSATRYKIPQVVGEVALRVGDDGKARIAYEADGALWYGVFEGAGFRIAKIPETTAAYGPVLVLGAGDRPYLTYHRGFSGRGGCAEPDPPPYAGTYLGTQVGGSWQSERLTTGQGETSLTIDVASGAVHALVNDTDGLVYVGKASGGQWKRQILDNYQSGVAVIRRDPHSGELLVVYLGSLADQAQILVIERR